MPDEKRLVDGYEITQSVTIGGMEIVIGENLDAEKPYMTWRRSVGESFGAETHLLPIFDGDYLKIYREFIHSQSVLADGIDLDRVYRGSPLMDAPLCAADCVNGGMTESIKGKIMAIKAEALSPEYRACSHQLMLAQGGFGCSPGSRGQAVFGVNIYSGAQERWNRSDILGVVSESALPEWAREKATALQNTPAKESVLDKIREGVKSDTPRKPKQNDHNKRRPEL